MLESYAQSYGEIAARLVPELPAGWSEARVLAEMRADNGMVVGFARLPNAVEPLWLDLPNTVYDAFRAMHDAAVRSGDPAQRWTSATLRLQRDGTFNVQYGYDPVPIEDQFERVDDWTTRNWNATAIIPPRD
jgi:hypothetical protein